MITYPAINLWIFMTSLSALSLIQEFNFYFATLMLIFLMTTFTTSMQVQKNYRPVPPKPIPVIHSLWLFRFASVGLKWNKLRVDESADGVNLFKLNINNPGMIHRHDFMTFFMAHMEYDMKNPVIEQQRTAARAVIILHDAYCSMSVMRSPLHLLWRITYLCEIDS